MWCISGVSGHLDRRPRQTQARWLTAWDADGGCEVVHRPVGIGRTLAAIAFFAVFLMLVGAGS